VLDGIIHPKPEQCPEAFYDAVIKPCFEFDRKDRPVFGDVEACM
jgi:hypothetical protein